MSGWLIDTLLYTGLLIALVLVLRRPVGRFFGPQLAYGLWALPFIRLLLPPIVLPASFAPEPAPAPAMPAAEWAPVAMELPIEAVPAVPAMPAVPAIAPTPAWEWADLAVVALSVWAGVALAFLVWRVVTYRQMRRELLEGARPVGEIGKVRLLESPALASPVAFGVLDKVIALPPLFMAQPDIAARDLAIAHELAHHKGHDLLANFAAQALLALHWFNPLAWMGWRAMRRDQEAACDARVLAGRGREERIRYAALIAGVATGPRLIAFKGALAAPMACQVLGERSIVHRLRSLSMSETSRRRRWLGRTLIAGGALALPLSASISYAAAQAPPAPAPPAPPSAELAPLPPEAPEAPELRDGDERHVRTIVLRREGPDGEPIVRQFTLRHPPEGAQHGEWDSEEFEAQMEQFQAEMEQFQAQWQEQHGGQWEQMAEQHRAQALAMAEQARRAAPQVIVSCGDGDAPVRTSRTEDGRQRIVICNRRVNMIARSSLRSAREAIARNREISEEARREVLQELDEEIERIERNQD